MQREGGVGREDRKTDLDAEADNRPDDTELMRCVGEGDAEALRLLMERYDRLVRYAVFRLCRGECAQDPAFLDARASEVWTGLVRALQGAADPPDNLKTYLLQITRNRCHDALRRRNRTLVVEAGEGDAWMAEVAAPTAETLDLLIQAEEVLALRECIEGLTDADKRLYAHSADLLAKRWKLVGEHVDLPASTVRSRWAAIVARLRACLRKKSEKKGDNLAPPPSDNVP